VCWSLNLFWSLFWSALVPKVEGGIFIHLRVHGHPCLLSALRSLLVD
jgi:hypothetical protein